MCGSCTKKATTSVLMRIVILPPSIGRIYWITRSFAISEPVNVRLTSVARWFRSPGINATWAVCTRLKTMAVVGPIVANRLLITMHWRIMFVFTWTLNVSSANGPIVVTLPSNDSRSSLIFVFAISSYLEPKRNKWRWTSHRIHCKTRTIISRFAVRTSAFELPPKPNVFGLIIENSSLLNKSRIFRLSLHDIIKWQSSCCSRLIYCSLLNVQFLALPDNFYKLKTSNHEFQLPFGTLSNPG